MNNTPPLKTRPTKEFSAYTLAELIITLTILGVISVITISNALNNFDKKQIIVRLKIAYSALSRAVEAAEVENGPSSEWASKTILNDNNGNAYNGCSSNQSDTLYALNKSFFDTYIAPNMNVLQTCRYGNANTKCFATIDNKINGIFIYDKTKEEPSCYNYANNSYQFMLKNGISYAIAWDNISKHFKINVDVNGPNKGKSVLGEDVFVFVIDSKGLHPYGDATGGNCKNGNIASGAQGTGGGKAACAGYIIGNNWKYPADYPDKYTPDNNNFWRCGACCVMDGILARHEDYKCGNTTYTYDETLKKYVIKK